MFRYERPQMGRQRQFHQVGVETFGLEGPDIEAEHLLMTARLWRRLGVADRVRLEINSLGSSESRAAYRSALVAYLSARETELDEDSRRRLGSNPLRILDSKNPDTQALLRDAPRLVDHLDAESQAHFAELRAILDAAGLSYTINSSLVRGLDYYGRTVYEWVTESLGAQGTVCAGGRYDGLVSELGGPATSGVGFAMGLERLLLLMQAVGAPAAPDNRPHAYWVVVDAAASRLVLPLGERLRDALPGLRLQLNCGAGSMKSQMKRADRSGAALALIVGSDEMAAGEVSVRELRIEGAGQQRVGINALQAMLAERFAL
jgi:histidyl-tRNA synthetase